MNSLQKKKKKENGKLNAYIQLSLFKSYYSFTKGKETRLRLAPKTMANRW